MGQKVESARIASRVDSLTFQVKADFFANRIASFKIPLSNQNITSSSSTQPSTPGNSTQPPQPGTTTKTTNYETRNVYFNQYITAYSDSVGNMFSIAPIQNYSTTVSSRDFLILYYNAEEMTNSLYDLCESYSFYTSTQVMISVICLVVGVVVGYSALAVSFIACTAVNYYVKDKKVSSAKVFFHISRDIVGHIYQTLKRKNGSADRKKFGKVEHSSNTATYNLLGIFALPVFEYIAVAVLMFLVIDVAANGLVQKVIEPQVYVKFADYSRVANRLRFNFQEWGMDQMDPALTVQTQSLTPVFDDSRNIMNSFSNLVYQGDSALTKLSRVVSYLYNSNFSCVDEVTCFGFHDLNHAIESEFIEFLGNRGFDKKSPNEVGKFLVNAYEALNSKIHSIIFDYWRTKGFLFFFLLLLQPFLIHLFFGIFRLPIRTNHNLRPSFHNSDVRRLLHSFANVLVQ